MIEKNVYPEGNRTKFEAKLLIIKSIERKNLILISSISPMYQYIRTFENHPENEDDIITQSFSLGHRMPLQVRTTRFGQETQDPVRKNATVGKTEYINTLLNKIVTNPPPAIEE